jgi:hypothetical protein
MRYSRFTGAIKYLGALGEDSALDSVTRRLIRLSLNDPGLFEGLKPLQDCSGAWQNISHGGIF